MRAELAAAVGGLVGQYQCRGILRVGGDRDRPADQGRQHRHPSRTAVERDYRGDILDAHSPEMPTRFIKQLCAIGSRRLALGMRRTAALRLAMRCARDSFPPLRSEILLDLAGNPDSRRE